MDIALITGVLLVALVFVLVVVPLVRFWRPCVPSSNLGFATNFKPQKPYGFWGFSFWFGVLAGPFPLFKLSTTDPNIWDGRVFRLGDGLSVYFQSTCPQQATLGLAGLAQRQAGTIGVHLKG